MHLNGNVAIKPAYSCPELLSSPPHLSPHNHFKSDNLTIHLTYQTNLHIPLANMFGFGKTARFELINTSS